MLRVMSWRTTPLSASTFGPLDPSPGNGPAVSSGISAVPDALVAVAVGVAALPPSPPDDDPHAASTAEPSPPASMPTARRRLIRRGRS